MVDHVSHASCLKIVPDECDFDLIFPFFLVMLH